MQLSQQNVILKTVQLWKLNVIPNWKTNHKVPLKLFHSVCLKRFFPRPFCNLLISTCVLYIHDENNKYKEKRKKKKFCGNRYNSALSSYCAAIQFIPDSFQFILIHSTIELYLMRRFKKGVTKIQQLLYSYPNISYVHPYELMQLCSQFLPEVRQDRYLYYLRKRFLVGAQLCVCIVGFGYRMLK